MLRIAGQDISLRAENKTAGNGKGGRFLSRMGVRLWISFLLLTSAMTLLFYFVLAQSVRLNYVRENTEDMERVIWDAMGEYGSKNYYDHLSLIAKTQGYYVAVMSEEKSAPVFAVDTSGNSDPAVMKELVPGDLYTRLDAEGGDYHSERNARGGSGIWAIHAVVIAVKDGNRQVLVMGKSLVRVDQMLLLLRKRALFAFFCASGIAVILSLLLTRFFARPLQRLTGKAEHLARGDYSVQFQPEGCYEVRQLSDTMEMAAREFQRTEQMRRDIIANISHDMRTPLTVIRMYTEMVQTVSGEDPKRREAHLDRIQEEVDKLTEMIRENMDLSKLQSGTFPVKMKEFDLGNLIRSAAESCRLQYGNTVTVDFRLEADLNVRADRKLIARVLQNLIGNAMKFSDPGSRIILRAYRCGSRIRTEVQDFGPGIQKEELTQIWDRYYTSDPHGESQRGTGLGLHIAAAIFHIHQMEYGVESEPGKGSRFWFFLPAAEGE